jgi:glycerol-3-phosphate acyltransferase PlsY
VLTGAGVLVGLNPLACLVVILPALAVMLGTKYMSLTSITGAAAAALVFAVFAVLNWHEWAFAVAACIGAAAIIVLHKDNIERLRGGVEPKIGRGGNRRAAAP